MAVQSQKYELILDSLQKLLESRNLQTISVSEIAQTAGIGKGSIYYLGCGLEEELLRQVMAKIWEEQGICCEESPEGVEIVYRGSKDHRIRITLNHNAREVEMDGVVLAPFACRIEEE